MPDRRRLGNPRIWSALQIRAPPRRCLILRTMSMRTILLVLAVSMIASAAPTPAAVAGTVTPTLTVVLGGTGGGGVTSNPSGIDCPATCSHGFTGAVTLTATADAGSVFAGWKGGGCSGTGDCSLTISVDTKVHARFLAKYRPDAWIKLCGLSTGCTVGPPPPHPWHGNHVYNSTGAKQTVAVRMEDGEGARFWLRLENDGAAADTVRIKGCKGNPRFLINAVVVGWAKRPDWHLRNITRTFKTGTATLRVPPASTGGFKKLTVNIVAPTTAEGISYSCRITIVSKGDPSKTDTVVGKMTTT
jgi:hypothetical protein